MIKARRSESPFEEKISLQQPQLLPFIGITNPDGFIDESGTYSSNITVSEQNPEGYNSLDDILMQATFNVQLLRPQTHEIIYPTGQEHHPCRYH